MHDSERRPGAGRPSLLSADQAPAQEDRSVLSQLDGRAAPARTKPARPRAEPEPRVDKQRGLRAAVFGIAFAGIATLAWLALGSVNETDDATLAAAHLPARATPVAAPPVAEAPIAPAASALDAPAAESTAALIQEEVAAPAAAGGAKDLSDALHAAPAPKPELASLLDAPAPVVTKAAPAAPRKDVPAKTSAKPAPDKIARNDKPRAPAAPARPKPVPKSTPKPAAPVDTDVALLAALLAHTKAPEAGSPQEIYKRCATNATAAEVQRCRVRVCQGSAKGAAECKSVRISKVSS